MKSKIGFAMIAVFFAGMFYVTPVFAEQVTVSLPEGSSVPGCEETNECYIPYRVTVNPGDEVVWSNDDTAAHTVTSGTPAEGPDGIFDSSLFMAGNTFSHTFDTLGEYDYFCMVHPWMQGIVFVTVGGGEEKDLGTIVVGDGSEEETTVTGMSNDGKVRVEITATNPMADEIMSIDITFRDSNSGSAKKHANYDVVANQNGNQVLSVSGAHEHEGMGSHTTSPLSSEDPVDIQVTMLGFGLPDDEPNWTGPKGEFVTFNVVPEFGTLVMLVMVAAVASALLLSGRFNQITPKF